MNIRTCVCLTSLLSGLACGPAWARCATATETVVNLMTYPYSDPDPVPATDKVRYPYCFFDGSTTNGTLRSWKAVVLENERIRVTVLPEIGGKVWGALDKQSGTEFIYFNHVVKFRNISMRGPWCSGGIEFNFGIIGHSPTTAVPVSYYVRTNADGSASCFLSDTELICGTTWQVEINLPADADCFYTRTIWFNGSNDPAPYYQWMTAAYSARGNPEFFFPGVNYIGHTGTSHAWPIDENGHDLSKYAGNAFGSAKSEHVLNGDNRMFGIWWPERNVGSIHRNHVMDKYGRKVFLWAQSRAGGMWEDLLTDTDGQYVELQSGRCFNQPYDTYETPFKHPVFAPGATHSFDEEWGVVRDRRELERYMCESNFVFRPQRMPDGFDKNTAYGHYVMGEQMLRQKFDTEGERELKLCLEREPCFAPALGELAALALRRGQYALAHTYAEKALAVNTYDFAANFADGRAYFAEGDRLRARERLGIAAFSPEYATAAFALVAKAELADGNWAEAVRLADLALRQNALNVDARLIKIVSARKVGDDAQARRLAEDLLAELPLCHAARYELNILGTGEQMTDFVRGELPHETYLELGHWYADAGLREESRNLYSLAAQKSAVADVLLGNLQAAKEKPISFIFPFRGREIPELLRAAQSDGHWKLRYYAAVALAANDRNEEARTLLDACGTQPDDKTFYLYRASQRKGAEALSDLRRAQRLDRACWRTGVAIARYFIDQTDWAKAAQELCPYVRENRDKNAVVTTYAMALAKSGRARETVDFLSQQVILPAEFGGDASVAWIASWGKIADDALRAGELSSAREAIARAISYPENLGRGRPYTLPLDQSDAEHPTGFEDWTPAVRAQLDENGLKPECLSDTRPYEFIVADRREDSDPPWIDFETETGWRAEAATGVVKAERSQARQLFGKWTLAFTLNAREARLRPAKPLTVPVEDYDFFGVWMRGARMGYDLERTDKSMPVVDLVFVHPDGREEYVSLTDKMRGKCLNWSEWYYVGRKFTPDECARIHGLKFDGFRFEGDADRRPSVIYIDNLAFRKDELKGTLSFAPRPKRNLKPLKNACVGLNTGEGVLSYPTREETAAPESFGTNGRNAIVTNGSEVVLSYCGDDGSLVYRWRLGATSLDALSASWNGGRPFSPMAEGGALAHPERAEYELSIRGKTLFVDIFAPPGETAVSHGHLAGVDRVVSELPIPGAYDGWRGEEKSQSLVPAFWQDGAKLFCHVFADWYRSNASREWRVRECGDPRNDRAELYYPKTDGTYNPVSERLFVTVSPEYAEVLPTIANPPSPWKHVTGKTAWVTYGSTDQRGRDKRHWKVLNRYGLKDVVICDHEICMRDGGESFTFRDRAAPGKGGDAGLKDYAKFLIERLGYRYGPYNNYTDFAPVNANWSLDRVGRESDGSLTPAWVRCYSPKPAMAIEASVRYAEALRRKFGFNTAYCDVHTTMLPWARTDYDARVPGAGTYAQTFYAYAEVLEGQRRTWNGPVYSEGEARWYYAGICDANYGQMLIDPEKEPWLVDFDLLKIHPLECDFGVGNPSMFYRFGQTPEEAKAGKIHRPLGTAESSLDLFIAAELAYGHGVYLAHEYLWSHECGPGPCYMRTDAVERPDQLPLVLNSYYMPLPLARRYTQTLVREIAYMGTDGRLRRTSEAIFDGSISNNQIVVAYRDGTVVIANGSLKRRMRGSYAGRAFDLPATGYCGWSPAQKGAGIAVEVRSTDVNGHRYDYASSDEAVYLNTRGKAVAEERMRGTGVAILRRESDGVLEFIPVCGQIEFRCDVSAVMARGEDDEDLGEAGFVRSDDGFVSVLPVPDAFSYRIFCASDDGVARP